MLDATTLLDRMFRGDNDAWNSELRCFTPSSAFQPLISLNHRRVVGQEALLRVHDRQGKNIGPIQLLNSTTDTADSNNAQQQAATAQQQAATAQQQAGALPIGSIVSTLPAGCTPTQIGDVEYQHCGANYYRAAFQGNNLVYVVAQP